MEVKLHFILFLFHTNSLVQCYKSDLWSDWLRTSCKVFCLEKLPEENSKKNLKTCSSLECSKCSKSCIFNFKKPCLAQCPNSNSTSASDQLCVEKCKFLKERNDLEKPGVCPKVLTGFALADVARCTKDMNCPGPEKCCIHSISRTCQEASFLYNSTYPPLPQEVRLKQSPTSLLVSWKFPSNSTWKAPTIFIVEMRQTSGLFRPSNGDFSFWNFAGETSSMQMVVRDTMPSYWYQVRVIAYSINGTNGYSRPSRSIRVDVEVRRPSPPRNFTALGAWFQRDKICVNISWKPPVLLDLPVRRYRLIYYKHVDGTDEHYLAIPVKRKKVSGQLESTVLVDLEANSVYVVKIQAMLAVGRGKRLKGRWNILYLRTPSMVKVTSKGTRRPVFSTHMPKPTVKLNFNISLKCLRVSYSKEGFLSAVVRWKVPDIVVGIQFDYHPKFCKEKLKNQDGKTILLNAKKKEITLVPLYEDCQYFLTMKTYFSDNSEAPFKDSLYFSTFPDVKTTSTISTINVLNSNTSSRLKYSCYVFAVSFLMLIFNLVVFIL